MFSKEGFEILPVDEAIRPVVNLKECLLIIKLLRALYALLLFFHDPIERNFLFKQTSQFTLDFRIQKIGILNQVIWPLS